MKTADIYVGKRDCVVVVVVGTLGKRECWLRIGKKCVLSDEKKGCQNERPARRDARGSTSGIWDIILLFDDTKTMRANNSRYHHWCCW